MTSIGFETFFWIPNTIYKALGFDFQRKPRPRWLAYLLKAFMVFTISSGFSCRLNMVKQLRKLLLMGDVFNSIRVATYIAYAIDSTIKFFAFLWNVRRVRKIYGTLAAEYPQTSEERLLYRVDRHHLSRRVRVLIGSYYVLSSVILFSGLVQAVCMYAYELALLGNERAQFAYLKPVPMPYDFEYRTPLRYLAVYTSELMNGYFSVAANMGTDLWLSCLTAQICMHLEYVGRTLESYEPSVEKAREDCEFLTQLIRKHQLMLSLYEELNGIFGVSLIFNLMSTTAFLCLIAVQLSIEGLGYEFLKFLSFFLLVVAQFFMVCQRGQTLITVSQNVAVSAYNNRWYNASTAYKKLLLVIIIRAQKRAELTAKGFQPISLDTFKISYEPSVEKAREDCEFLTQLIRKHQLMLSLYEELNGIFGVSLIFNLMSTTAFLCLIAVQLSIEGLGYEFLKFLSFFLLVVAQFFMVCQRGQTLITVSQNVAVSAYNNRWYNASTAYKKLLLVIIIRAQKRAELTAKGFQPISLDTFKIVMGMTYRVFAVLQTMLN